MVPLSRLVGRPPFEPSLSKGVLPLIIAANDPNGAISLMQTFNRILNVCNVRYFGVKSRPLLLRRPPKKPIFGFGRRETAVFRSAEKKKKNSDWSTTQPSRFKFLGGRKSCLAAEHHNEKKKPPIGHPPKKADLNFWGVEKVIWPPNNITRRRRKKKCRRLVTRPSRFKFWGGRKSYLAAEHHNEAAPKK